MSRAVDALPPSDMLATVGRPLDRAEVNTKFSPDTMSATEPELVEVSRRKLGRLSSIRVPSAVEDLDGDDVGGLGHAEASSNGGAGDVSSVAYQAQVSSFLK